MVSLHNFLSNVYAGDDFFFFHLATNELEKNLSWPRLACVCVWITTAIYKMKNNSSLPFSERVEALPLGQVTRRGKP